VDVHPDLARLMLYMPSVLLKPYSNLMEEEVNAYLSDRAPDPVFCAVPPLVLEVENPIEMLRQLLFENKGIRRKRTEMINLKDKFVRRIQNTHDNFSPQDGSRFSVEDASHYARLLILSQILETDWPGCAQAVEKELKKGIDTIGVLKQLNGIFLYSLVQYCRYYLCNREPDGNDYGDIWQTLSIPYCQYAIVEKDLHDELNQLKRYGVVLSNTEIRTIKFLRELAGISAEAVW